MKKCAKCGCPHRLKPPGQRWSKEQGEEKYYQHEECGGGPTEEDRPFWMDRFERVYIESRWAELKTSKTIIDESEPIKQFITQTIEESLRRGIRQGRKLEHSKCDVGCPYYSSGHSIDVDGNCNMGCC